LTAAQRTNAGAIDAAGPLDAPALVLVHGSVVSRKMWLPQLRSLSDAYRVIAPDLPGHGELGSTPWSFGAAVEVVARTIEREARGRALVVGLSLGGYVAMRLAHRHPDAVSGLVLVGCSRGYDGAIGVYLKAVASLMRHGYLRQSPKKLEEKTRRLFSPTYASVADEQVGAGLHAEPLADAFTEMASTDWLALVAQLDLPILIVNGERDTMVRRGEKDFVAAAPATRVVTLAGAGHACNLDRPEEFDRAVREFARSIGWIGR
jgi:pimeloyl-ACP methyl ester carboxylesterase